MRLIMLGINHRTAGVQLREQLALSGDRLGEALTAFRGQFPQAEVAFLSTCNRTELYFVRPTHEPPTIDQARQFLAAFFAVNESLLTPASIHRENDEAIAHLFRVCVGLDSMVLGEPQVLGQVKRAYEYCTARQTVGPVLHKVIQQALAVGKQVRTSTGIDTGRVSIGSVAVDFARQIFERFDDKVVVGIGAGEMAKITLKHLQALKPAKLWLTNRTLSKAEALAARLGLGRREDALTCPDPRIESGQPLPPPGVGEATGRSHPSPLPPPDSGEGAGGGVRAFADLDELLVEADIVLTGTAATEPIITAERFKPLLRRRRSRPLFLIDIAMPRDVDPAVGALANVYLYNLDDLQKVIAQTFAERSAQVQAAEKLLLDAARECMAEIQNRDIGQLIRALRERLHGLGQQEKDRTARKLAALSPEQRDAQMAEILDEHTHRLVNKILHLPLSQLDRRQADAPLGFYAAALRRLFALENEESGEPQTPSEKE